MEMASKREKLPTCGVCIQCYEKKVGACAGHSIMGARKRRWGYRWGAGHLIMGVRKRGGENIKGEGHLRMGARKRRWG